MLNTAVQNKAFPLAGLMYANVNVSELLANGEIFTNLGFLDQLATGAILTIPNFARRYPATNAHHVKSTQFAEFCASIKKSLLKSTYPAYGYSAPAKSGAGIGVLVIRMATYDAPSVFFYVVNSVHLFFSVAGIIRAAHKIMVGCVGASSEAPVTIRAGYANPAQLTTSKIGVFGGGVIPNRMEAAAMLATTPTKNPQFIWLIAAVRRDMPTLTAKIHHIAADSEHEARRTLTRDHVCFFAGRIRQEAVA